jgi:vitamin B12 transporter
VFLQDQFSYDRHNVFLAVRLTDHKAFGDKVSWNAEYALNFNDQWTLNAGLGHAYRAPDATDRFGFGGNVDLRPEVADEYQLGASFRPTLHQTVRLQLYRNDIRDLIEFSFPDFTAENIGKAEIRGAQLGYELLGDKFTVRADLLIQTAENAVTGERLLRRPEESLTLSYTQQLGAHRLGVSVLASGDREDFATSLPGYLLVNLTGQLQIGRTWQFNARIENVLDTEYQTADPFRMQERSGFVELKYGWE